MTFVSRAIFRNIRGHLVIGCVLLSLFAAVYWLHTDQLLHPPDLGSRITSSLESGAPHDVLSGNTTSQGLLADLETAARNFKTPSWTILAQQVDNPEVEGKITDNFYGLWAYYLSNTAQDRTIKSLWDAGRRKGMYFTMVFRKDGMKQTTATCNANDGPNSQVCVLGFLPSDNGVSLIDLPYNRLYGTLNHYGPKGGAAHALKQYKHSSGHFPLVFIVEAAGGAEMSAEATGYAVIRSSMFRGFSLRWYKLVLYAEMTFGLIGAFWLLRAIFYLVTFGHFHPMWTTLKACAAKPRKNDPAVGKDANQIAQDIDRQLTSGKALAGLQGHYDAQLGCFVCRTSDNAEPCGYISDTWAVSRPSWSADPVVRHVHQLRVEVERIGETEAEGAVVSIKTWQPTWWLWWKRILMFQFVLGYSEAQEMQRELSRRAAYTQPGAVEAMRQHLKLHAAKKGAKEDAEWTDVLSVNGDATLQEIAIAYKRLSLEFHPEKAVASFELQPKQLTEKRRQIQAAFENSRIQEFKKLK